MAELRQQRQALEELWQQGVAGRELLRRHTALVDAHLQDAFARCPADTSDMVLLALGGYGRQELFPYSDIDLLLVHTTSAAAALDPVAAALFHPLWDAGLEVGHGVRTPAECLDAAGDDFFFRVALLDGRYLAGNWEMYDRFIHDYRREYIERDGRRLEFCEQMGRYRTRRHTRFGRHSYLLEPHVKESRGGLRDIQAMAWIARVVFGLDGLAAMEDSGLLTAEERQLYGQAWEQLIKTRNHLHYASNRKNDQLYFEYQEAIAGTLGYAASANGMLGVERFMQDIHEAMQTVVVTTELFFEHVDEVLTGPRRTTQQLGHRLEEGIELRLGRLCLTDLDAQKGKTQLLLRLFLQAARRELPIHHRTRKEVAAHLDLVDDRFRSRAGNGRIFLELLIQPGAYEALVVMLETGLLAAYLPEFQPLVALAQHDVYHVNTVDRHLLQTVAEVHVAWSEKSVVTDHIDNPVILYLAALLHDIGKGKGAGHAERGALLAADIGRRLGLSAADCDDLVFLVGNHLLLMHTALRRDLQDQGLIARCALAMQTPQRLSMLYLLTVADARATGPTVWNDWKGALVFELYLKVVHLLDTDQEDALPVTDTEQERAWMLQQVRAGLAEETVVDWQQLPTDYLTGFEPSEIVHHIGLRTQVTAASPVVEPRVVDGAWELLIMSIDRPGLLARICGVLALHNLEIRAAQIFTWNDGTAVDVLQIGSTYSALFEEQDWDALRGDLSRALQNRLALDYRLHKKLRPRDCRRQLTRLPITVEIDNAASDVFTVVEIYATERMGLLYDITKALAEFGMNISRAIIGSRADQVVDVFYIQDQDGEKIQEADFVQEMRHGLLHAATHVQRQRRDIALG